MPRIRRPFERLAGKSRDARLIIIATEDTDAARVYFDAMASSDYYQTSKVHVTVLSREDKASAPNHVIKQLDRWSAEYQISEEDELWLVIDVDQWGDKKLKHIAKECVQKKYYLAISNPAIELWFLLHLTDLAQYDENTRNELQKNAKVSAKRTRLEKAIIDLIGRYDKGNLRFDDYLPYVEIAIERAEKLDVNPSDRWPQQLGTRVHLLARSIIDSRKK
jgi:hypothetical protein